MNSARDVAKTKNEIKAHFGHVNPPLLRIAIVPAIIMAFPRAAFGYRMSIFAGKGERMPQRLLTRLRELIQGNPSVRKVADDPALMAELLLLFRMVLADGKVRERELEAIRRIAAVNFGIEGDDLEQVLNHLQAFGYEITPVQAIAVFREFDVERRLQLARHMADLAKADEELGQYEVRLLARVVEMLDLDPKQVVNSDN